MMFRSVIILSVITGTFGTRDEVFKKCIETFTNETSNDYLLGTWHQVYQLQLFSDLVDSSLCPNITFAKPTAEELKIYKDAYDDKGYPFILDENSLTSETDKNTDYKGKIKGMYSGKAEAKYWVSHPDSKMRWDYYKIDMFHVINKHYMVYWDCTFRGLMVWLLSRHRHPALDEMLEIIKTHRKLRHLQKQRFCAPEYVHPKNRV